MANRIATFVKTIGISPLKTRLAATSSRGVADQFYQLSISALEEWMLVQQLQKDTQCYWAVAEDPCLVSRSWASFPLLSQGVGGLDHRLATICSDLQESSESIVTLVGADAPQLPRNLSEDIEGRIRAGADLVIGPSTDGGFYLFSSKVKLPKSLWFGVEYSQPTTLRNLLSHPILQRLKIDFLPPVSDVDEFADLSQLAVELATLGSTMLPKQKVILEWLKQIIPKV